MLVRFDRFPMRSNGDVLEFEKGFNSLFDGILRPGPASWSGRLPAVDVAEYPAETVIVAELPGVKKEDVKISFEKGLLTISGERKSRTEQEEASQVRSELRHGSFTRSFEIGHEVNADAITAELADGILRVVLPKVEEAKPREISVKVK